MSNKIKSIKTIHISENTDEKGIVSLFEERDQEGNITLYVQYNEKGEVEQKTERILNEKGQLLEEKNYTTREKPDQHILFDFNESGKVSQATVQYLDGSISYRKYTRDEAEHSTTIEITDNEGVFEGKEFRRFDNEGRVLEEVIYDEDNNIIEKTETEYDDYGRIIETVVLDIEGIETVRFYDFYMDDTGRVIKIETLNEDEIIIRSDEFEYDERGNQVKHIVFDKTRGMILTDLWEYDIDNKIINHKHQMGENLIQEIKNRYRADNLLVEQETLTGNGISLNSFEYSFH